MTAKEMETAAKPTVTFPKGNSKFPLALTSRHPMKSVKSTESAGLQVG